jgi:hypothetical protein
VKVILSVVVCLAALVCARPAAAQSVDHPQDAIPAVTPALRIPIAIWTAAVAADHVTTFQFRSRYPDLLHEENPLVRGLENHPGWLVGVNGAIDAATGWAAYRWLGRSHPRLAQLAFYSAAAYRTYLSAHNMRMMGRARALSRTP